jgi:hypothetical protein
VRYLFYNAKYQAALALAYFLFSVLLGLLLRGYVLIQPSLNYKYIVHAHSHLALLGWVYLGLTTVIYALYPKNRKSIRRYRRLFLFTNLSLVGMLATFPWQGYGLWSIFFSTLFLFTSYGYYHFFNRYLSPVAEHRQSHACFQAALIYMVLSSAGPWALGAIMSTLGPSSVWYRMSVYFYLHFQYNAWMFLGLLGILLHYFESQGKPLPNAVFRNSMRWIHAGILLSFLLSALWTSPPRIVNVIGGLGILGIGLGLLPIGKWMWKHRDNLLHGRGQSVVCIGMALVLSLKLALQALAAIPYFAALSATYLDFIIGYLHWTFLGLVSLGLFLAFYYSNLASFTKTGLYLYIFGFITSEALIFYRGLAGWQGLYLWEDYAAWLWVASLFMGIGILWFLVSMRANRG